MNRPLVSILTPSLDQVDFVGQCIRSVRCQTYREIEHVVVDAGSTDGTLDVLNKARDARLTVLVRPGTSQAEALNIALSESRGSIVGWVNTDDALLDVGAVAAVVDAFESDGRAVAVYGDGVIAAADGRILRYVRASARRLSTCRETSPLVQPSVFVRRTALEERFLRPDLQLTLDYELWLWLRTKGRFRKIPRVLAIDRDHGDRKTRSRSELLHAERDAICTEYRLRRPPPRPIVLAERWLQRIAGLAPLLVLDRRADLAFDGSFDGVLARAKRQLLRTQASLLPEPKRETR